MFCLSLTTWDDMGHFADTQEYLGLLPKPCHYHSGSLNVPFIMFFLNMVNYPEFFLLMSTLTWDTLLTLRLYLRLLPEPCNPTQGF